MVGPEGEKFLIVRVSRMLKIVLLELIIAVHLHSSVIKIPNEMEQSLNLCAEKITWGEHSMSPNVHRRI